MITISSNLEAVAKELRRLADDGKMRRALSTALTRTAKDAQAAIQRKMPSVFDRPTPFTLKSVMIESATAQTLSARVFIRDEATKGTAPVKYLAPQAHGGARNQKRFERQLQAAGLLPPGMYAVPGEAAKLDGYGNWDRGQIVQVVAFLRAFGEQGYKSNMSDKRRQGFSKKNGGVEYFVGRSKGGRGALGIWARYRFAGGSAIKPIALFVRAPKYKQRFDFQRLANDVAVRELPVQVKRAVDESLARMAARG